ncbi:hypothetical protein KIN20_022772 [Parelaphostrongylus tenuis]|uniref:Uncharacterized protein n=1 Tax=Parelaphostrongylus tenuis TaxID=148309 RepID=A0AAD5MUL0_PARTN|nr:hypothetical protein KIN20_022772 [Parelaphostrongylus tenuis]
MTSTALSPGRLQRISETLDPVASGRVGNAKDMKSVVIRSRRNPPRPPRGRRTLRTESGTYGHQGVYVFEVLSQR